ncbi:adenosylcobinamide amidohydrolase [Parasporobacterium paucivorans]|uniref:Adenosylcobinamide amidohydrolase n=1 Tax=Parasporobacterium paucivorans DSM 15970 TaxID=1122934 RepID=A0A1M6KIY4_9FIRM|nr:adenosylcobinamide amidohydrolase [Parasporobacterium paucivorans]SHJ58893.1 Adenosylcobinamide amidohydrolase [Parasporobacterium paucivorans DSM 15970]
MVMHTFPNGDEAALEKQSVIIRFAGKRRVLSTSNLNGGISDDLSSVFNNDCKPLLGVEIKMLADTYEGHLRATAKGLGLDDTRTCGLCTSAYMKNTAIVSGQFTDFTVTAVVTAGVDHNGGRAGDPAFWRELDEKCLPYNPGTINIMLHIDADLTQGAITRALVTCTEAKTAALQELLAPSLFSDGLATGSGTDGTIIITDLESEKRITEAGKQFKMGEYIGKTVKEAVKKALFLQTGLTPLFQFDAIARMQRFGVSDTSLWEIYRSTGDGVLNRTDFTNLLFEIGGREEIVIATSLYAHLLDQMNWEMIPAGSGYREGMEILDKMGFKPEQGTHSHCVKEMVRLYSEGFVRMVTE